MKAEQQSVEGASGILASMKEQDKSPGNEDIHMS